MPGSKTCSGSQPQACDANGAWQNAGAACGACNVCSATTGTCVASANGTACSDGNACTSDRYLSVGGLRSGGGPDLHGTDLPGGRDVQPGDGRLLGADERDQRDELQRRQRLHADRYVPERHLHGVEPGELQRADLPRRRGRATRRRGTCSTPTNATNGTSCNDGNACTQTDTCQSGTCTGSNPVTCTAPACKVAGTCNPSTGTCSTPTNATNGTGCNDGNACTQTDTCQGGTCTGGNVVACGTPATCHAVGTCNTSTGICSTPTAADNTTCSSDLYGICHSGSCGCYQGVSPVSCTGGPSCMNWGFESGTVEGWGFDPQSGTQGVTKVAVSTAHAHTGTYALAVSIAIAKYSGDDSRGFTVAVPLCSPGTVSLAGYTVSFWVYFTVSQGTMPMNAANLINGQFEVFDTLSENGTDTYIAVGQSTINQWLHFQANVVQSDALNNYAVIAAEFPIADPTSEGFAGTMYVDDFQLSPP